MIKKNILFILLFSLIGLVNLQAQGANKEKQDLEKAIQNPIAALYTLPFQNNTQFGIGKYNRTQNVLNIQPVIPVALGEKVNMIVRTIIPVISQPIVETDTIFGLGDIARSIFFTPRKPGKLIWGVGPAIGLPTGTDQLLGTGKWSAGPAIIALIQSKGWTFGLTVQNRSFAGNSDRQDINAFYSQVFIVKNLKKGWSINSAPIITANWKAESGQEWLVPQGIGAGKLPINARMGYYNYLVAPDNGPEWQLRAQVNLLFPR